MEKVRDAILKIYSWLQTNLVLAGVPIINMINDIKNSVAGIQTLIDNSTVGNTTNSPQHYNSTALENMAIINVDTDTMVYSIYAINTAAADQYIQVHELPASTNGVIGDDGAGNVRVTVGNTFIGGETIYFLNSTGTPLLDGLQTITAVDPAYFDIGGEAFVAGGSTDFIDVSDGLTAQKTYPITAGDDRFVTWLNGKEYSNGLMVCNSSTILVKTIGAADCVFEILYANV